MDPNFLIDDNRKVPWIEEALNKDYPYILIGIALIVLVFVFSKKLESQKQVTLDLEKMGFHLEADRFTLFYLLGFLVIGVGVFFKFKGYEARLLSLEDDLKKSQTVKEQLSILKEYEFDMFLDFDETLGISPKDKSLTYRIYKFRDGKIKSEVLEPDFKGPGVVKVSLEHIKPGEKFRIVAEKSNDEQWGTEEIEVPKTRIKLTKMER
ncbi:hypothetical protein [Chitinophaga filiformis]|uniref:Uncharacterized protein n=1 Tax=Chitinophaga filiformis TaxID=104663 RepID=A0A1G7NRE0_CHIFI|nr:hypothetical protein [Chitinophaga filiformis]SDF76645.1 hypothetical protein SAMN04488121_102909 [Chitinophaga filiformis]